MSVGRGEKKGIFSRIDIRCESVGVVESRVFFGI